MVKPARRYCPGRRKGREAGTEPVFVQKEVGPGKKGGPGLSAWSPSSGPGTIGQDLENVQRVSKLGKWGPGIPGERYMMSKASAWFCWFLAYRIAWKTSSQGEEGKAGALLFACKCWKPTTKQPGGHVWCASLASIPLSAAIGWFGFGRGRSEAPTLLYTHSL